MTKSRWRWWLLLALPSVVVSGCGHTAATKVERAPTRPEAADALADAGRLIRLGPANYDRALDRLDSATQSDGKLWEAFYDRGWIELKRHRGEEAVDALEHALKLAPARSEVALALAEAYLDAGRAADAAHLLASWIANHPDAPAATRIELGRAQRLGGKLDDAIESLRQVLRITPRSAEALNELGLTYRAKQQLELAELVLHRAVDALGPCAGVADKTGASPKPDKGKSCDELARVAAETWNDLGLVALTRRRDQEAFAHFDQAARLDPSLTAARRNKAAVYLDCGDYARAATELKQVTHNDPRDIDAWVALGVAERGQGQLKRAQAAYESALEIDPAAADALYDLGVLFLYFDMQPGVASAKLTLFLRVAPKTHPHRPDAESRVHELAPKAPVAPQSTPAAASSPAKRGGS